LYYKGALAVRVQARLGREDQELIDYLRGQANRSEAARELMRAGLRAIRQSTSPDTEPLEQVLRRVLREELASLQIKSLGSTEEEDSELADNLDSLFR